MKLKVRAALIATGLVSLIIVILASVIFGVLFLSIALNVEVLAILTGAAVLTILGLSWWALYKTELAMSQKSQEPPQ